MRRIVQGLRARLERVPGEERPHTTRNGVVTLAAAAIVVYVAFVGAQVPFVGGEDGAVVRAEFEAANELQPGDPVRVGGVQVGEVERVELSDSGITSVVAMRLENDDVVLRRDAEASIRWRLLLGGSMYVELSPGSASAPTLGERAIPVRRTSSQVEFDQFFQPFDGPTGRLQQTTWRELRGGFADPAAAGEALETLSPTLSVVDRGLAPLRGREAGDLRHLVASTARTARALSWDPGALAGLVEAAAATFRVTANRRTELGELIERSPSTMDSSLRALRHMTGTLDRLDPLVARLRPGARSLAPAAASAQPALREADAFLGESRPLLRKVGPTFEALARASERGVPLIHRFEPVVRRLDDELLPWLAEPDPDSDRPTFQMIGPTAAAAASAASQLDGYGYWLRFPTQWDERSYGGSPCQPFFTDPTAEEKLRCEALHEVLDEVFPGGER